MRFAWKRILSSQQVLINTKKRRKALPILARQFGSSDIRLAKEDDEKVVSILEDRDLLSQIPLEDVRNFCFIAHIDHGKSSLSSRLLEICGNLGADAQKQAWEAATGKIVETGRTSAENRERIEALDTLSVEKERGITVKASAATMLYKHPAAVGPTGTLLLSKYTS